MGQIKNIKLHIVTDIKCNNKNLNLVTNTTKQDDQRNTSVWQTPQQVTYTVCAMWPFHHTISRRKHVLHAVIQAHVTEVSTGVQRQREERQLVLVECDISKKFIVEVSMD